MKRIKTWRERCEEHPDHQTGMISERMIQERMQEEIDELRQTLKRERVWVEERHAAWHEGFEAGRKAERDFCAAVCDEKEEAFGKYYTKGLPKLCAEAIRARGNT
jgi:hypothetical protein